MRLRRITGILAAALVAVSPVPAFAGAAGTAVNAEEQKANDGFGFSYGGSRYTVGMDAEEALRLLGEPTGSRDVNNCARGAVRKAYTYGDGDVEVFADLDETGTKDVVKTITLMSGRVATEEGLKAGDPEERIPSVYPGAVKGLGGYTVKKGGTEIYIYVNRIRKQISYITYQ